MSAGQTQPPQGALSTEPAVVLSPYITLRVPGNEPALGHSYISAEQTR